MSKQTIQSAWAAFEESLKFETMDDYRKDGWRCAEDFTTNSGITREALVHRLNKDSSLECKTVKVFHAGGVRKKRIYRPKVASLARK